MRRKPEDAATSAPQAAAEESKTSIIRRHPTGGIPEIAEPSTTYISSTDDDSQTTYVPRARSVTIPGDGRAASPAAAIAAAVVSILSGWATAVIATDLITGWWRTDPLFCVAVGFLTAVSAGATIGGLVLLLLRRRMGRLLIVVGSIIALMIFASLFVAGAKLPPVVYGIPALPLLSIVLTLLPATRRWARP
nr:hypothetical protein [Mycobacterium sp. QGD 101]